MEQYKVGDMVTGFISGIESYGIFLLFDHNYTGLIHISELSNEFVKDVSLYGKVGEEVCCRILEIDEQNHKLKCSIKDTQYGKEKDALINHGFYPLRKQLPIWMAEKQREYQEK